MTPEDNNNDDPLKDVAYIVVKRSQQSTLYQPTVWYGHPGVTYAPSIIVRPEDIEVVRKQDLASTNPGVATEDFSAHDGRWYNINRDMSDTIERDPEGKWQWTNTPGPGCRQPNVWICSMCERHCVMTCACGYVMGWGGTIVSRTMDPHEYQCVHLTQDPDFVCRVCDKLKELSLK
jgi:hypothetical protein